MLLPADTAAGRAFLHEIELATGRCLNGRREISRDRRRAARLDRVSVPPRLLCGNDVDPAALWAEAAAFGDSWAQPFDGFRTSVGTTKDTVARRGPRARRDAAFLLRPRRARRHGNS